MKDCAWCSTRFEPVAVYQIYCSVACREAYTKSNYKERNAMAKIKRRMKKQRYCANKCGTPLSIYNDSKLCATCQAYNDKLVRLALDNMKEFFTYETN